MTKYFRKSVLAAALAATALAGSAPAMADGYRGSYYHGGYGHGGGAGTAVAAGIFGLAIGAIIASSAHHDDRYDEPAYAGGGYYDAPYVQQGWAWHDGYYWDRDGNRYGRDGRFYGSEGRGYDHRGYDDHGYRAHGEGGGYYYGDQRAYEGRRGY